MPPSPAMAGREIRAENHKRGRSLESGMLLRDKDDDLALFNQVQNREEDNFLLQSNDDFEDNFSTKLSYFTDHNLGISVPVRGESNDLLNEDGDKEDYEWLITPPDTPLFPSLDDEAQPANQQRGRPRSQPISISRSSTMEKGYRSSRGSASPNRLSSSPRSGNSTLQTRGGRPSSASHSSPTHSFQHVSPSGRPSPPPNKSSPPNKFSPPAPRSSTPRRMSTSFSGTVASSGGVRGVSPVKSGRGNSSSPQVKAWQSNIPGFSSEAPPNLRTSLADRPASYVRGISPASRNGRSPSAKSGRQSMSPTTSRSVSSSHSHEHDQFIPHSKGLVASSGEDDLDSLQSVPVDSCSNPSASRRPGASPTNRALAFSKKPTRILHSSSAPKRSFDSALRQMDNRKGPQNMFRPLLSSVPSSTFYVGKADSSNHAMISKNSAVTASSYASFDQGTSGAHDMEGNDKNQEDVTSERVKEPYPDVQDEIFVFDKADSLSGNVEHVIHDGSPRSYKGDLNGDPTSDSQLRGIENFSNRDTSKGLDVKGDSSDFDGLKDTIICSKCGQRYRIDESIEGDFELCPTCNMSSVPFTITTPGTAMLATENSPKESTKILEDSDSFDAQEPLMVVRESTEASNVLEEKTYPDEEIAKGQPTVSYSIPDGDYPNLKVDVSEGAGISVLLKQSTSGKGPVVQSRIFTACSIPYDDPSYARDGANSMRSSFGYGGANSMRSSIGYGSASASSSVDFGPARQKETRVQRQLSGRKSDLENYRHDTKTKHQRSVSSLSGISNHAFQPFGLATSTHGNNEDLANKEQLLASEHMVVDDTSADVESNYKCDMMVASTSELSNHIDNFHSRDNSVMSCSNFEESVCYEYGEDVTDTTRNIWDVEASATSSESSIEEGETMLNSFVDREDAAEVAAQSSLDTISEIQIESAHLGSPCSQSDVISPNSKNNTDELQEPPDPTASDKDITSSAAESDTSNHAHGILEESSVTIGGTKGRSLTLEEATDAILFCSSIIHNLAYDAASIAVENENSIPLEGSHPTVTILGKANSDRKDLRALSVGKRAFKSQKVKQRLVETDTKPPINTTKSEEKTDLSTTHIVGAPPNNGDDMKPPPKLESKCNCRIM